MKKYFLLAWACLVAGLSFAQRPFNSGAYHHGVSAEGRLPVVTGIVPGLSGQPLTALPAARSGAKSTSAMSRWYNFADFMLWPYQDFMSKGTFWHFYTMWNDTSALIGYTDSGATYRQAGTLSMGMGLDPTYTSTSLWDYSWNSCGNLIVDFTGQMAISYFDAYTIDSAFVAGIYVRNNSTSAKAAVVDTLILSFVKGATTGTTTDLPPAVLSGPPTPYGLPSINYHDLFRDTVNNCAAHNGGSALTGPSEVYKFLLTSADSVTTSANSFQFPRRGHIPPDPVISYSVAAAQVMVMTATFKSGDTSYHPHAGVPGDTIRYSSGTAITGYKYNNFMMEVAFATTSPTATTVADVTWPFADNNNHSCGYFEFASGRYGAPSGKYLPQWSIVSGGTSPSTYTPDIAQYPVFAYHAYCSTCYPVFCPGGVNEIQAEKVTLSVTPNPADGVLNFTTDSKNPATIVITNALGQQVASQSVINGHASFSTGHLPSGVYCYIMSSNGSRSSGRVVITH